MLKGKKKGNKKGNSDTNIPSKPTSVTNAAQGFERGVKNERSSITDDSSHTRHGRALARCDFESRKCINHKAKRKLKVYST